MIGNYSSTNDGTSTGISAGPTAKVFGFTLPTGSDYTLDNITLRLLGYNTTAGEVALLRIYEDVNKTSTDPIGIGSVLQSLLFTNPSSSSDTVNNFTFTPASTFTFKANTRYWVSLGVTAGQFNWSANSPSVVPTGLSGITNDGYRLTANAAIGPYTVSATQNSFDIQATVATSVPFDFDPSLGVAVLGGGWLLRKHLKNKKSTKV